MTFLSSNFVLQTLGIVIAMIGVLYLYLKHVVYNYWNSKGVNQLETVVPFGSIWSVLSEKKSFGEFARDGYLRFKHSRVFGMYSLHKPILVICDPDIIRFVLTKEFSHFQDRGIYCNPEIDPLSGHLFALSGPTWKNLRVKFSPTFTSGKMKYMFAAVKQCSDNLAECVAKEVEKNNVIEVKDIMGRFTTDVIASIAFGIDCNSLGDPDSEFRAWGRKIFVSKPFINTLGLTFPAVLRFFNIPFNHIGATKFFMKAFEETVKYRTTNNVVRKDFLNLIMQLMDKGYVETDDGKEWTNTSGKAIQRITLLEGAAQAFIFWIAGFETSSTTATHCLYELAKNQDIQDKLANEINAVLAEFKDLTYDSINAMPYLSKVVNETLRKYPPLSILNRECNDDIDLLDTGIRVTKGTAIVIPVYGLHSDPDIFPDPEKFDPERFNEEKINSRHRYAYIPFGEGPRNCIGLRLGLIQTKIGLIQLLSKYRFTPGPNTISPLPVDKGNLVHCPLGGVTLRIEKR